MTVHYEITEHPIFGKALHRTNEDGSISSIPNDPANSDYQAYLRWLENPDAEINQPTL